MASILARYLDPDVLNQLGGRSVEPRGLVQGNLAGGHRSPMAGFAVEFKGHREYVRGDDPKHIDWRLFYTRDKLFIKQYEMETNFVCHLLLDVSASMRYGEGSSQKLGYAARLATTLAYAIVKQNDKVSLATLDRVVRGFVPPGQSLVQIHRMVEHLEATPATDRTDLPGCLMELTARTGRRGIVMLFSDLLGDPIALEASLQQLRFRDHEVVLFQVLHPDEREFQLGGMVKFVGLEEDGSELTQAEDVRDAYLAALARHQTLLSEVCQRNRVELVEVDSGAGAADALVDYLDRRSRVARR